MVVSGRTVTDCDVANAVGRSHWTTVGQCENYSCDDCDGHRRRKCNADPHGTSLRRARPGAPGSARCRRAPAIAFAPRTESREASSVLARCRRVCGRCVQPSECFWVVSSIRVVSGPGDRRVETLSDLGRPIGGSLRVIRPNLRSPFYPKDQSVFALKNLAGRKPNPCAAGK